MAHATSQNRRPSDVLKTWSVEDSKELYNIDSWGAGFFGINAKGNVDVSPRGPDGPRFDLKELVDELRARQLNLPLLIRFSDIIRSRLDQLNSAFDRAMSAHEYKGAYMGVFPIKVNQQRHVVEEIIQYGEPHQFGLEAGSKPELIAVLAMLDADQPLIICNGYKDSEYIDLALWGTKLGKTVVIVVEEFSELERIIERSRVMGVSPQIGFRMKLSTRGSGRWQESGGVKSKFGLTITEMLRSVELLRELNMLDSLVLTHFHLGSQITNIRSFKEALSEASRLYVELKNLGGNLRYFDVGGGMAVDYDGSSTTYASSANYSMDEYVADIVDVLSTSCNEAEIAHPTIVTECGRAIVAHHSALIFNVLGVTDPIDEPIPATLPEDSHNLIFSLHDAHNSINSKNFQEVYHDVLHLRDEAMTLFKLGYLTLKDCGVVESIFWAACRKIQRVMAEKDYVPDELKGLEQQLASTYACNFSIFQSVPDCWAVDQLLPIMPIHRLGEEPNVKAVLADITCDSDGRLDSFIDRRDFKNTLEVHKFDGGDYLLGIFMTGAYQEILGDMHNLFGDTNAVHVTVRDDGQYFVDHIVDGDTVEEVLRYVQYAPEDLLMRLRRGVERALRAGRITFRESADMLRSYEDGLKGYTYLEPDSE
ncbi:MAG: biosynthetic arginine decarboxylase [Phycisphaerales bacterium]|nr:biosynthetic arginine decarboxylase [Phycisphaerales bacterium]MCB9855879.1 biosynthetic arginine decarboxylase [Phycisphaerales bacterium]